MIDLEFLKHFLPQGIFVSNNFHILEMHLSTNNARS